MNQVGWQEALFWAKIGSKTGSRIGAKLAVVYAALPSIVVLLVFMSGFIAVIITNLISEFIGAELQQDLGGTFIPLIWAIVLLLFGIVVGSIPAIILGSVTGAIIGAFLSIAPHRWNRRAVGFMSGIAIVVVINQSFAHRILANGAKDILLYLYFFGIPSLIYLGACAWLSDQLPQLVKQHYQQHERPVLPMKLKETSKGG